MVSTFENDDLDFEQVETPKPKDDVETHTSQLPGLAVCEA